MIKVGFSGSRYGMTPLQQKRFKAMLAPTFALKHPAASRDEFHHGDCKGSDAEAHTIIRLKWPHVHIVVHPPEQDRLRAFCEGDEILDPLPYLTRNRRIVQQTNFLIGCPIHIGRRAGGTWRTIEYARQYTAINDWRAHVVLDPR